MNRLPSVRIASSRLLLVPLVSAVAGAQTYPIWTADGPAGGMLLGRSVASAGDADADGVPDVVASGVGFVRVYAGGSGSVLQAPASPTGAGNWGASVAGVGDLDGDGRADFAVGAPGNSVIPSQVDVRSGATGATILTLPGQGPFDMMGLSVASPGDVTGDGLPEILVGGQLFARLYSGAGGAPLFTYLLGSGRPVRSVAGAGDLDGDGVPDVFLGFPVGLCFGAIGTARAYSGASGVTILTLNPPPLPPCYYDFASSVASAGDLDGDGVGDLLVGAPTRPDPTFPPTPPTSGLARACSGSNGAVLFSATGSAPNDLFGNSVAGIGDVSGDGVPDVLVGAPQGLPSAPTGPGYARVLSGAGGTALATIAGAAVGDQFGATVASLGDVDGDGVPDFAVGAPNADPGGIPDAGQVRVVSFVGIPPTGTILGAGCPGTGGIVPRVSISGGTPDSAGNPAIAIHLSNALGGTVAVLIVGLNATSWMGIPLPLDLGFLGIPGCSLVVSADVILPVATTAAGRGVVPAPTPADPSLSGASIFFQWYVVDPGPALLPGAMSPGLQIVIV